MKHSKIAIIGAGLVGSTTAFALLLHNVTAEIILVDINEIRCTGEVLDLSDALPFDSASQIRSGSPKEAAQADIIIIAAGKAQKVNESRIQLLDENTTIITEIFKALTPINQQAIVIIVTNPVDLMTHLAQKLSGLPCNQVFGSGTFVDTQRLHSSLAKKLHISEKSIDAYILGEHGDTQFVAWSLAKIGGVPIDNFPELTMHERNEIATDVKHKAYEIISCKGATYFGIAACVAHICKAIIFDQKLALPLSVYYEKFDVCLSMPVILGENGIEALLPIPLNDKEENELLQSAQHIKKRG